MHLALCVAYFAVLLLLAMYGLHRSHLVLTCMRLARRLRAMKESAPMLPPGGGTGAKDLPIVTVQLPLYNEATVATRLIDYCAAIDYPRARLELQVLDDSTDETEALVRAHIARLRETQPDLDIVYLHRTDRTGYKAGALDAGLKVAKGELVAIFDADFLPTPEFLRALVPHFVADSSIGMVQARWGHLNREH